MLALACAAVVISGLIIVAPVTPKTSMPKIINLLIFFTMITPPKFNTILTGNEDHQTLFTL